MNRDNVEKLAERDTMTTTKLVDLLASWQIGLQAQRLSTDTIRHYVEGTKLFLKWCENTGTPAELTKPTVSAFLSGMLERGAAPTTARARWSALKRFSWWLAKEGERPSDDLLGLAPPKIDVKVVKPLTDDELRDLIKVCSGNAFRERRDEAVIRLMAETGMRAGECCSLTVDDVDLAGGLAIVERGKGGKGRIVGFGPQTARALDRYKRLRSGHRLAGTQAFWLGDRSRSFERNGLWRAIKYRAELAGIEGMHPHRLRHTAATRWLAAGGSEGGALAMMGWSKHDMLRRYVAATASERAAAEGKRLGLGDV
jgi:site-specific recombinase XerD